MIGFRYTEEQWSRVADVVADPDRLLELRRFLESDVVAAAWQMANETSWGGEDRKHYGRLAKAYRGALAHLDDALAEHATHFDEFCLQLAGSGRDDLLDMRSQIATRALICERRATAEYFWGEDKGGRHRPRRNYVINMVLDAWCVILGRQVPSGGGSATSPIVRFVVHAANPILAHELGEAEVIAAGDVKGSDGRMRFGATGLKDLILGYARARTDSEVSTADFEDP